MDHIPIGKYKFNQYHFSEYVDRTLKTFELRLDPAQQMSQVNSSNSPNIPPAYLSSFTCFLGSDPPCVTLLKWHILDSTLQNSDKKIKLKELRAYSDLYEMVD